MKWINAMKLKARLMVILGVVFSLSFIISGVSISLKSRTMLREDAFEVADALSRENANLMKIELEKDFSVVRTVVRSVPGIMAAPAEKRRDILNATLRELLAANPRFLSVWLVMEPNALDGLDSRNIGTAGSNEVGRFTPTWYRQAGGIKQAKADVECTESTIKGADYYLTPKQSRREVLLNPYLYSYSGEKSDEIWEVSVIVPILRDGEFIGAAGVDIAAQELWRLIADIKPYEKGYVFLLANNGALVAHQRTDLVGKPVWEANNQFDKESTAVNVLNGKPFTITAVSTVDRSISHMSMTPMVIGDTGTPWCFGASIPLQTVMAKADSIRNFFIFIGTISLALMLLIIYWIAANTARHVGNISAIMRDIAEGEGDLTRRIHTNLRDEVGELAHWFNQFVDNMQEIILKVRQAAKEVYSSTEEVAVGSSDLASRTNQQAASVTETSATLEELNANVAKSSGNAEDASQGLRNFNDEVQSKRALIENVTVTMREIGDSSKKIDNIINVINDISFQTNLLALNAAVEAARAGEAGRGFAVVAAEVRNLAQKTAESSKTIQEIVTRNVDSTRKGMTLVEETAAFFSSVVQMMQDIVAKIEQIAAASREQSAGVGQINQAVSQLESVISQNAALVEELSATGKSMKSNANELLGLVDKFKVEE